MDFEINESTVLTEKMLEAAHTAFGGGAGGSGIVIFNYKFYDKKINKGVSTPLGKKMFKE